MTNKLNLLKKLSEVQKEINYFQKDSKGYNYKYVSGTEILSKIRPLMDSKNLLLIQEALSQKIEKLEIIKNDKTQYNHITLTEFKFTWIDADTGEFLDVLFQGQGNDNADKGFGMSATYAERYFLLKFFHVPTDEDDPDKYNHEQDKKNSAENIIKMKKIITEAGKLKEFMNTDEIKHYVELNKKQNFTEKELEAENIYLSDIKLTAENKRI